MTRLITPPWSGRMAGTLVPDRGVTVCTQRQVKGPGGAIPPTWPGIITNRGNQRLAEHDAIVSAVTAKAARHHTAGQPLHWTFSRPIRPGGHDSRTLPRSTGALP